MCILIGRGVDEGNVQFYILFLYLFVYECVVYKHACCIRMRKGRKWDQHFHVLLVIKIYILLDSTHTHTPPNGFLLYIHAQYNNV